MIIQGLILTLAGMGTVFLFLIVLICAIMLSSRAICKIEAKLDARKPKPQADNSDALARVAAAIAIGRTLLNVK